MYMVIIVFTGETCSLPYFSLAEILVLDGIAGAGRMASPASTKISARLKCVQGHSPRVNTCLEMPAAGGEVQRVNCSYFDERAAEWAFDGRLVSVDEHGVVCEHMPRLRVAPTTRF